MEHPHASKPRNEGGSPTGHGGAGAGEARSAGMPRTSTLACAFPNLHAYAPNWRISEPEYLTHLHKRGAVVEMNVTIDAHGTVISVAIAQSAGNDALDSYAIKQAYASEWPPEIGDCKRAGIVYLYFGASIYCQEFLIESERGCSR